MSILNLCKGAASIAVKKPNKISAEETAQAKKKQLSLHGKSIRVNSMYLE